MIRGPSKPDARNACVSAKNYYAFQESQGMLLASDIASETTDPTLVGSFTKDKDEGGGESEGEGEGEGQGIVVESFSQGHGHVAKTMMYFC
jgi:hypothetical protein